MNMLRQFPNTECRAIHTLFCYTPTKKILLSCERTPRLQRWELPASTRTALQLRGTAAAYTLSTGVDSRATHGTLCVMSGR